MNIKKLSALFKHPARTEPGKNIYHCCVQKTGSQWIKLLLSHRMIKKRCGIPINSPNQNFIKYGAVQHLEKHPLPENTIITPLYINYPDFMQIQKPELYKAFFIKRDPRDILISWYFSVKFSHNKNQYIEENRKLLETMDNDTALTYLIKEVFNKQNGIYKAMESWEKGAGEDEKTAIFSFEDLIGPDRTNVFGQLLAHIEIQLNQKKITTLLANYDFKKMSQGREVGTEDVHKHYRKGISGDWKNYFTNSHKDLFKEEHGQLLTNLGYEKDSNW